MGAAYLKPLPSSTTPVAVLFAPCTNASTTRDASVASNPNDFSAAATTVPIEENPVPVASAPRTIAARLLFT